MRIVIDMQSLQTGSANRGIGRYASSLTSALLDLKSKHEFFLLFNAINFEDLLLNPRIRALIERAGVDRTMIVPAPGEIDELHGSDERLLAVCKMTREIMLQAVRPDAVLMPSLFEFEAVLTVPPATERSYRHATIAHDFIPLSSIEQYMPSASSKAWYYDKLQQFRHSDLVLCNSGHTRDDVINRFGFHQLNCMSIFGGCDLHERYPEPDSPDLNLAPKQFILYCATYDPRKNVAALISAYARLPQPVKDSMPLVLGGRMHPSERDQIDRSLKDAGLNDAHVRILGYVEDPVLAWLYKNCRVFVFPSLSEGLGLPPMEAMTFGAPVVVSNRTSLPEVVGWPDQTFDPDDPDALAGLLQRIATDDVLASEWSRRAFDRSKEFSWHRSAQLALASLELHAQREVSEVDHMPDFDTFIGKIASVYDRNASQQELASAAVHLARARRELERLAAAKTVDELPLALASRWSEPAE